MSPAGFEPEIALSEPPQTDALNAAAIGIGKASTYRHKIQISDQLNAPAALVL
jgi:hypothetical protein